jgi:hypothetical protein
VYSAKRLIRGPDQDVRVLGPEHEILIELFHDVIKARDGCAASVARLDPDRVKERQLQYAIFRQEWATFSLSGITARPPARVISPLSISFGNARIGEADLYRGLSARKNEGLRNGRLWRKAVIRPNDDVG